MKQRRKGPATNRHQSAQDHPTPREFICAIEGRFDLVEIDLAATKTNAKAVRLITPRQNSLKQDWTALLKGRLGYLNPPFDPIAPWIDKCVAEAEKGARFVLLTRASIDSNWFWKMVPYAQVYALTPRITFVGSTHGYPSPLILSSFNCAATPAPCVTNGRFKGLYRWHWMADVTPREGYVS